MASRRTIAELHSSALHENGYKLKYIPIEINCHVLRRQVTSYCGRAKYEVVGRAYGSQPYGCDFKPRRRLFFVYFIIFIYGFMIIESIRSLSVKEFDETCIVMIILSIRGDS